MRRLLPEPATDLDVYEAYRPEDPHAPFLRLDMVASLDGRATDRAGVTAGLGAEADLEVFRTLRALADAVLVGAGTARTEGYGPVRHREDLRTRRLAEGRAAPARLVLVTRTGELDPTASLFTEADDPTVVLACDAIPAERRAALERVAHVVAVGDQVVDLAAGLELLRKELGLAHIVCEGGPTLNRGLLEAGLVDEICLTVSPQLVGGPGPSIVADLAVPFGLALTHNFVADRELFLRYRVQQ